MSQIERGLGDPEVILLGVDRLDYTKGIGLRLRAFAALLEAGVLDPEQHVLVRGPHRPRGSSTTRTSATRSNAWWERSTDGTAGSGFP